MITVAVLVPAGLLWLGFWAAHRAARPYLDWWLLPLVVAATVVLGLQTGALLNEDSSGRTPLEMAAFSGRVLVIASALLVGTYTVPLITLMISRRLGDRWPRLARALTVGTVLAWGGFVYIYGVVYFFAAELDVCLSPGMEDVVPGLCVLGPD